MGQKTSFNSFDCMEGPFYLKPNEGAFKLIEM